MSRTSCVLLIFLIPTILCQYIPVDKHVRFTEQQKRQFQNKLQDIGLWLRIHKFGSVDQRYASYVSGKRVPKAYFTEKFPEPRLRNLTPSVDKACHIGLISCVNEIHETFLLTPIGRLKTNDVEYARSLKSRFAQSSQKTLQSVAYEPLANALKMFQYRTTSSYFMCYFALQGAKHLAHFGTKWCNQRDVMINIQGSIGDMLTYKLAEDFRNLDEVPFSCAFYSFCPDVCCGKTSGDLQNRSQCFNSVYNPCANLPDRECSLNQQNNNHLFYMIENKINYTCNCGKDNPGLRWSMEFKACVDFDECSEEKYVEECLEQNMACQNTIGSYFCTCVWGFVMDTKQHKCVRENLIDYNAIFPRHEENFPESDEKLKIKTGRSKQKTPWHLRVIYKLNAISATIFNKLMKIFGSLN